MHAAQKLLAQLFSCVAAGLKYYLYSWCCLCGLVGGPTRRSVRQVTCPSLCALLPRLHTAMSVQCCTPGAEYFACMYCSAMLEDLKKPSLMEQPAPPRLQAYKLPPQPAIGDEGKQR